MRRPAPLAAALLAAACAPPLPASSLASTDAATLTPARPSADLAIPTDTSPVARGDTPAVAPTPTEAPAGALVDLAVTGHAPAVVVMPGEGRRPVLVATHGAGGTPEAHCVYWRELLEGEAFVLCPRGVTMDVYAPPETRTWFYPSHPALEREVRAGLAALTARFPGRVDLDRAIYAGFSQGGVMGALAFSRAPAPFASLVLVEGGSEDWAPFNARTFAAGGGRRVLIACGRRSCADPAVRAAATLRRAGIAVRLVDASGAGHTHDGAVREGLTAALPWLLDGDSRFGRLGNR